MVVETLRSYACWNSQMVVMLRSSAYWRIMLHRVLRQTDGRDAEGLYSNETSDGCPWRR